MILKALKFVVTLVVLLVVGGAGYLMIAPPDLLRVGTNYSAKIVCSNVFIAGRDAQEVLAVDVQAPGHPLLKYISVDVDEAAQTVQTRIFGFFATATSQYRDGLGCTNVQTATLSDATVTLPSLRPEGIWPDGNDVALSQDPALLNVLSDETLLGEGMRAVVVVHNGRIIGETYGTGFDETTPLLGWSMTKTITAALVGTLIKDEKMALTDTLGTSYPSWAADARSDITLQDMLGMASGLQWNEGYGSVSDVTRMLYLSDDMSGFAASLPAEVSPGKAFNYSSGTTTMLSRVWQDLEGSDSLLYPHQVLFGPLGMTSAVMETDASDTYVGSSYMYATARDWARFGQFLLQKGVWNGEAILPAGFTDWMFEPVEASDARYGRGQIWLEAPGDQPQFEDSVWLQGHDGQTIGIFPSRDLVIVRLGLTPSALGYSSLDLAKAVISAIGG